MDDLKRRVTVTGGVDVERRRGPNKKIILLVTLVIVLAAVTFRPVYVGFGTYQTMQRSNYTLEEYGQDVRELNLELAETKSNLTVQASLSEQLMDEWKQTSAELSSCQSERKTLGSKLELETQNSQEKIKLLEADLAEEKEDCETKIIDKEKLFNSEISLKDNEVNGLQTSTSEKIKELETKLVEAKANFDLLVQNSARNICCKQKVDNPNVKSYTIINNKISCVEEGTNALVC